MALAGCSSAYIMSQGRWRTEESVSRYVEIPDDIKSGVSRAMATTAKDRSRGAATHDWGSKHTQSKRERLLPPYPQGDEGSQ